MARRFRPHVASVSNAAVADLIPRKLHDELHQHILQGDLNKALGSAARIARDALTTEAAMIFLIDDDDSLALRAIHGGKTRTKAGGRVVPNIATKAFSTRRPIRSTYAGMEADDGAQAYVRGRYLSSLALPLLDGDGLAVGVLLVMNKNRRRDVRRKAPAFTDTDVRIGRGLAELIAAAVERFKPIVVGESLLRDAEQSKNLQAFGEKILGQAKKLVHADRVDFFVWDEPNQNLRIVAADQEEGDHTYPVGSFCPRPSFSWKVWESGEGYRWRNNIDRKNDPDYYNSNDKTKHEICVRLTFRDRSIALINCESFRHIGFKRHHVEMLTQLARHASPAVQVVDEETRLWNVVRQTMLCADRTAGSDLRPVLNDILKTVQAVYGITCGLIYIYVKDAEGEKLKCEACVGRDDFESFEYKRGEHAAATWILANKEPFYADNAHKDDRVNEEGLRKFRIGPTPMVGLPLRFENRIVGVLMCFSDHAPHPKFEHQTLLDPLATLAAMKIAMWQNEQERSAIEDRYRSLVDNAPISIFLKSIDGKFTYGNPAFAMDVYRDRNRASEVKGKSDDDVYDAEYAKQYKNDDAKVIETKEVMHSWEKHKPAGSAVEIDVEFWKIPLLDANGNVREILGLFWDVTETQKAHDQTRKALAEKESLLRELNHRVRNNLQVASSVLELQADQLVHQAAELVNKAERLQKDGLKRLKAMSVVHDMLTTSQKRGRVAAQQYFKSLCDQIRGIYAPESQQDQTKLEIQDVSIDSGTLVPWSMIVHELVSNALRHAFPERKTGVVRVALSATPTGGWTISVCDDGIGMPTDQAIDLRTSYGLQFVQKLVKELGGRMMRSDYTGAGTCVEIFLPASQPG